MARIGSDAGGDRGEAMNSQDRVNRDVLTAELRDALVELGYTVVGGRRMTVTREVAIIELEKGDTGMTLTVAVTDPSRGF